MTVCVFLEVVSGVWKGQVKVTDDFLVSSGILLFRG